MERHVLYTKLKSLSKDELQTVGSLIGNQISNKLTKQQQIEYLLNRYSFSGGDEGGYDYCVDINIIRDLYNLIILFTQDKYDYINIISFLINRNLDKNDVLIDIINKIAVEGYKRYVYRSDKLLSFGDGYLLKIGDNTSPKLGYTSHQLEDKLEDEKNKLMERTNIPDTDIESFTNDFRSFVEGESVILINKIIYFRDNYPDFLKNIIEFVNESAKIILKNSALSDYIRVTDNAELTRANAEADINRAAEVAMEEWRRKIEEE